jgi:phospholipid-binding lipoprotein MlaA
MLLTKEKPFLNVKSSSFILAIFTLFLFAGCALQKQNIISSAEAAPEAAQKRDSPSASGEEIEYDDTDSEEDLQIADPFSAFNRGMHTFNDKLYFWVLKPMAKGYASVVPEKGRASVRNFFNNLAFPVRFVSNIMQARMDSAGTELARFAVNTTLGVAGLNDVAKEKMGLEAKDEDIGQALGSYKIGHGFYVVWPFFGPSSLRDTVGFVGDKLLYPVTYINPMEASAGVTAYESVNSTSLHIGDYESLKEAAIDPYISIRNAYIQNRKKKVDE